MSEYTARFGPDVHSGISIHVPIEDRPVFAVLHLFADEPRALCGVRTVYKPDKVYTVTEDELEDHTHVRRDTVDCGRICAYCRGLVLR